MTIITIIYVLMGVLSVLNIIDVYLDGKIKVNNIIYGITTLPITLVLLLLFGTLLFEMDKVVIDLKGK